MAIVWTDRPPEQLAAPLEDPASFAGGLGLGPEVAEAEPGAGEDGLALYAARHVLDAVFCHGRTSTLEEGGLLLGRVRRSSAPSGPRWLVDVALALPADDSESKAASFRFGARTWTGLRARWRGEAPGLELVGWYHTHPNLGAFFSAKDRSTQRAFFAEPWQVGLVIDPVRIEAAWFAGAACVCVRPRTYGPAASHAPPPEGCVLPVVVVRVGRRHELATRGGTTLRLAGIAFPTESGQPKPVRRLVAATRRALARLAVGRTCVLRHAAPGGPTPGASVHLDAGGSLIAERALRAGLGFFVPEGSAPFTAILQAAEDAARAAHRGIWAQRYRRALGAGSGRER